MKCPVCKKIIGGNTSVTTQGWAGDYGIYVVPYHYGKNGKPCSGSGR